MLDQEYHLHLRHIGKCYRNRVIRAYIAAAIRKTMVLTIVRCLIMNRLLMTGTAFGILLGASSLALAEGANTAPYYSGGDPAYSQPMPPPSATAPAQYVPQSWPTTNQPHSAGTGGRAYPGGQKTN